MNIIDYYWQIVYYLYNKYLNVISPVLTLTIRNVVDIGFFISLLNLQVFLP